jgi:hypothetical protein
MGDMTIFPSKRLCFNSSVLEGDKSTSGSFLWIFLAVGLSIFSAVLILSFLDLPEKMDADWLLIGLMPFSCD